MKTPGLVRFVTLLAMLVLAADLRATDEGYTNAAKVRAVLKTTTDNAGQPIQYPRGGKAEFTGVIVELPPGKATGWHIHPNPCVAYILDGEVTVELENGSKRTFKAGDAFAEVVKLKHNGTNTGAVPVKILLYVCGEEGQPISVATPLDRAK